MLKNLKHGLTLYKEQFGVVFWSSILTSISLVVIYELFRVLATWVGLSNITMLLDLNANVELSGIATILGMFLLIGLGLGILILYVKQLGEVAGVRELSNGDYDIRTMIGSVPLWLMNFLLLYIPIILILIFALPDDTYIYSSAFEQPLLTGIILGASQILLVMWGTMTIYTSALVDLPVHRVMSMNLKIFIRHFVDILVMTAIGLLVLFPLYAIPVGFGLPVWVWYLLFIIVGFPFVSLYFAVSYADLFDLKALKKEDHEVIENIVLGGSMDDIKEELTPEDEADRDEAALQSQHDDLIASTVEATKEHAADDKADIDEYALQTSVIEANEPFQPLESTTTDAFETNEPEEKQTEN